ncbi:chloroplast lipoate protein ligase [Dendrothele bispora CBS 962.96]|uniref:Octanoyltransferase n=1 Tax=Dendrothele bispora (strain CBS 962.96) TaxID=1314807 RepID=A0A4S8MSF6_DENBC|nr:chloroplast lipoate protein ligase [Dendrothele bispora CBS 962.96]
MSLPPIFFHKFPLPLPYARTLALQERLHALQLAQRKLNNSHKDILLLLEHRPVYTAGRRQTEESVSDERTRLTSIGADFVRTNRGGELTYHGPGQIVGYPLLDLSRYTPAMGIRDYICHMQTTIGRHLREAHGLEPIPSDNTGVFLSPVTKVASIGVQVRHRLTTHGFSLNVTREPLAWFDRVIACGLVDVKAVSIESAKGVSVDLNTEIDGFVERFGKEYAREMVQLDVDQEGELGEEIRAVEEEARKAGEWARAPTEGDLGS